MKAKEKRKRQPWQEPAGKPQASGKWLVKELRKLGKKHIFAIIFVKHNEKTNIYTSCTINLDGKLEDYVNIDNLTESQRYIWETAEELADRIEKEEDRLNDTQHTIVFSDSIDMNPCGITCSFNQNIWKKNNY